MTMSLLDKNTIFIAMLPDGSLVVRRKTSWTIRHLFLAT